MTGAAVHADGILRRLEELWRVWARPDESELLRACAMTLMVLTEGPPTDPALAGLLTELMLAHPFRAVVVGRVPGAGRQLEADVTVHCALARGRRTQICCEQIRIGATAEALADLPPVVRGLAAADLPVVVWLSDAAALKQQPCAELISLADRLIVDSAADPHWQATLRRARTLLRSGAALADLAWLRLTPWRSALTSAFDDPARRGRAGTIQRVELHHAPPSPPPAALYLAAWLRLRLPGRPAAQFVSIPAGRGLQAVRLFAPDDAPVVECTIEQLSRFPAAERLQELLAEELSLMAPDPSFGAVLAAVLD